MPRELANTRSTRKVGTTKSSFFPWSTVSGSSGMFSFNCSSLLTSTEQNRLLGRRSIMVLNNSISPLPPCLLLLARAPRRRGHAIQKRAAKQVMSTICESAEGFCHGKKLSVGCRLSEDEDIIQLLHSSSHSSCYTVESQACCAATLLQLSVATSYFPSPRGAVDRSTVSPWRLPEYRVFSKWEGLIFIFISTTFDFVDKDVRHHTNF